MKKNQKIIFIAVKAAITLTLALLVLFAKEIPSKAAVTAPGRVTGIKQTDAGSDGVKIRWSPVADAEGYMIALSKNKSSGYEIVTESIEQYDGEDYDSFEEYWVTDVDYWDMEPGSTYYLKVIAYKSERDEYGDEIAKVRGAESPVLEVVTVPRAPGYLRHTKSTEKSISMSWGKAPGANTYKVIYNKVGDKKIQTRETTGTSITLTKLSKDSEYHICVQAGKQASNGFKTYGTHVLDIRDWGPEEEDMEEEEYLHEYDKPEEMLSDDPEYDLDDAESNNWRGWTFIPVTPQKINKIKAEFDPKNTGKVRVTTNKRYSADGYEYELWSASDGKSKKIKSFSKKGFENQKAISDKKFKVNVFYKLRVRAYCLNGKGQKQRSKWSDYIYISRQPVISKSYRQTSNGLKIKWNKIKGASRYVVYVSSGYGKFSKFTVTKKNTINITKCYKKDLQHGRVYYFYIVAQKKAGNKYYNSEATRYWYCGYQ